LVGVSGLPAVQAVLPRRLHLLAVGLAIGVEFAYCHDPTAPRIAKQTPDAPAAGTSEQPELPVARLPAVPQERQHLVRVCAAVPVVLGHRSLPAEQKVAGVRCVVIRAPWTRTAARPPRGRTPPSPED